ncbi:MAG: DUF2806 domain-containing protein [Alphaproteobacteria bacterium]|nr:DUF2806 domain-containing protein [Alphaproteobacteria bacterium]
MSDSQEPIENLKKVALNKAASKFRDFVVEKITGKSMQVHEAEGKVEADKILTRWNEIEKPLWLKMETAKMQRQYSNFENTLRKTIPHITATENKISDDNDTFAGLLEHSKEISNEEMQDLIAKIIAGEYNAPGAYSMHTLQIVKTLDARVLKTLEKVGGLVINKNQIPVTLFESNEPAQEFLSKLGIRFEDIMLLLSLGLLLSSESVARHKIQHKTVVPLEYFGKWILYFSTITEAGKIEEVQTVIHYGLTQAGEQILQHLNPQYSKDYFAWLQDHYKIPYCEVYKPDPA